MKTLRLGCLAAFVLIFCSPAGAAPRFWTASPYRVRVLLVPIGTQLSDDRLLVDFQKVFTERLGRGVRPLWQPRVEIVSAGQRRALATPLLEADSLPPHAVASSDKETDDKSLRFDKTILVVIDESPSGLRITAREYDGTLDRWGTPEQARTASWPDLVDAAIDATTRAFSPLAAFELDPDHPSRVRLSFRGEELEKNNESPFGGARAGDVLLPYFRKMSRNGSPLPNGVQRVPWTYLVVPPTGLEPTHTAAQIYSHARSPFGTRRRGRVEQLALVVHTVPDRPTILRLHDRKHVDQPLSGYEVFVSRIGSRGPGTKKLIRLGRSNEAGEIAIPSDAMGVRLPVLMAHIKCGSSVVASLPIGAGVAPRLAVPLLDERHRLAAETKVAALREELVDLVARRRIFATRIRGRLQNEDIATAEKLLRQVESLPGLSQFNQRLARTEQLYRAKDPIVQRRLDRLFTETRSVLGSALDAREIRRLANEVLEAKQNY